MFVNSLVKKYLTVGIILLFIGTSLIPVMAQDAEKTLPTSRGKWLYVGGSGPGNYTNIPDAMDNASNGDTIFVYSGIYGTLTIRKSLTIIGESKYTTVLNGSGLNAHDAVAIEADDVTLSGFTIQNGGNPDNNRYGRGISLQHRINVKVSNIILTHNYLGIIHYWNQNVFLDNLTFIHKGGGISFWDGINCTIAHCMFDYAGISHNGFPPSGHGLLYIRNNVFTNNSIINLGYLCIDSHGNTTIEGNNFLHNTLAIRTYNCKGVNILRNNFIGNTKNIELVKESYIRESPSYINFKQNWINNYWDDWNQNGNYTIRGKWTLYIGFGMFTFPIFRFPFKEYDDSPAKEPYDRRVFFCSP